MEIIKQLYDIGNLFEEIRDITGVVSEHRTLEKPPQKRTQSKLRHAGFPIGEKLMMTFTTPARYSALRAKARGRLVKGKR